MTSIKTSVRAIHFEKSSSRQLTHHFEYVLSGVNADEPVEKFFGRARMRCGGNFYIDIVDVNAAARVVNLHALVQNDVMPLEINENHCVTCAEPVSFEETYILHIGIHNRLP